MDSACNLFGILNQVRFVGTWKTSEAENEKRRQMAAAAQKAAAQKQVAEAAELARKNAANARQNMQSQVSIIALIARKDLDCQHTPLPLPHLQLVDVLRTRNNKGPMFQSSHIKADEVKDGTFEEIILDMKKKPFRAEQNGGPAGTEHMRKSFRKE